jgi:hypothetical protein
MKDFREELWPELQEKGLCRKAFDRTYDVYVDMEMKSAQLEALCIQHGLSLTEWRILSCCLEGQMTDTVICYELFLTQEQLDKLVDGLKARALIGRKRGRLAASIEGRSAYYDVPPLAA